MQAVEKLLDNDAFIKKIQYIIVILFILLIALDVYLAIDNTVDDDTISNIIKSYTDNGLYILTFFWGAIVANFFLPTNKPLLVSGTVGSIILLVIALFIYWFSLGTLVSSMIGQTENDIRIAHAIYMVIGFLLGYLLWRQSR